MDVDVWTSDCSFCCCDGEIMWWVTLIGVLRTWFCASSSRISACDIAECKSNFILDCSSLGSFFMALLMLRKNKSVSSMSLHCCLFCCFWSRKSWEDFIKSYDSSKLVWFCTSRLEYTEFKVRCWWSAIYLRKNGIDSEMGTYRILVNLLVTQDWLL